MLLHYIYNRDTHTHTHTAKQCTNTFKMNYMIRRRKDVGEDRPMNTNTTPQKP